MKSLSLNSSCVAGLLAALAMPVMLFAQGLSATHEQRQILLAMRVTRSRISALSEPILNRTVVLRYRIFLEQKQYAPTTINLRLAAVRRLAFEAADSGLLSPELAAGIRRVKGVRRIGVRVGNWLTSDQSKRLLATADRNSMRGKRNYATLAVLIGCGLRRGELLALRADAIELREGRWIIANLMGKAGHMRTVPIPTWVKWAIDEWKEASSITGKERSFDRSIEWAGPGAME